MTLLALGDFRFGVDTAAYDELVRVTEYRWPPQSRLGRVPARQFVGAGDDTITLRGVIYPHHRGGIAQLDTMRTAAGQGVPLRLVSGAGRVLDHWAITRVEETQPEHWSDGTPRRQDFVLELTFYGADEDDTAAASAPLAAIPSVSPTTAAAAALQAAQAPIRELIGSADIPSAAAALDGVEAAAGSALGNLLDTGALTRAAQSLRSVASVARAPLATLVDGGVGIAAAADALRAVKAPLEELFDVTDIPGAVRLVQSAPALPGPVTAAGNLATAASSLRDAAGPLRAARALSGMDPLTALGRFR